MNVPVVPLHMGALHPHEQALTVVLAFGPFVLLGAVVALRRRQDRREDRREDEARAGAETGSQRER